MSAALQKDAFSLHTDTLLSDKKSSLVSRNITVMGRRTSVRLEPEMWTALREIARRESCSIHNLCSLIYMRKSARTSLTAAIRVFLILYYKAAATEEGHDRAGHGSFDNMLQRARMPRESLMPVRHIPAPDGPPPASDMAKYG